MFDFRDEAEKAIVYIYGTIGEDFWSPEDGNRAKEFAQKLDGLSPKPIDIHIDSSGGDVYEGFAIASAIQRYEGFTHAYIDGMAASAASYIAMMADRVTMNDYAVIMIHNAWTFAIGNRDELRDMADRLESLDKAIAGIITSRSALDLTEVTAAMSAETWYTSDDALVAGMCDEVIETEQRIAASLDRSMAKHFFNIPENVEIADDGAESAAEPADEQGGPEPGANQEPSPEGDGEGISHALSNLDGIEARAAEGAILLGNRVYRKEN